MPNTKYYCYDTVIGKLCIAGDSDCITNLLFEDEQIPWGWTEKEVALFKRAAEELKEYFAGERREFDLPLCPKGTQFMLAVWEELKKIPYGKTASYSDIAERTGRPKARRAVGLANNKNPIPIIIPCHRVIGKSGELVGYGGGLEIKKYLLSIEKDAL
ncbi:MAG: methylated-DNA--[protein]-cysteine S-methyltransferase [Clostridia bacterium]